MGQNGPQLSHQADLKRENSIPPEIINQLHESVMVQHVRLSDAIPQLRQSLVPDDYVSHPFRANTDENIDKHLLLVFS